MRNRSVALGILALLVAALASPSPAGVASNAVQTRKAACDHLRLAISKQLNASHGIDEYRCDDTEAGLAGYYVFAIRSNYPAPKGAGPDWVGSALVGWYAVRQSDGQVRDWDVANQSIGAVIR